MPKSASPYTKFTMDRKRLLEVSRTVIQALSQREWIFQQDIKKLLPQWNLPKDLEHSPQQEQTAKPYESALVLWTENFCDRMMDSQVLQRKVEQAWQDKEKRWLFYPKSVVRKSYALVDRILKSHFGIVSNDKKETAPGTRYKHNAQKLIARYGADPRNIISGRSVSQATKALEEFEGIGTGLANLITIQYFDRKLAEPTDPRNIRSKVDRHKARLPIMFSAIEPENGLTELHANALTKKLEELYLSINHQLLDEFPDISPTDLDAALWIIGSEVCDKRDYSSCLNFCPLENRCRGMVNLDDESGRFKIYNSKGEFRDVRKNRNQLFFQF